MNFLRTAWEALNEDVSWHFLIVSWCFFSLLIMVELFLPTFLGMIMDQNKIGEIEFAANKWLNLSAQLLGIADKLGILLLAYNTLSSFTKAWRIGH